MNFTPAEKEAIYRYLSKKVSLFSTHRTNVIQKIALEVIPMTFAPDSIIFRQGEDVAEMFYIIFQGTVEQKAEQSQGSGSADPNEAESSMKYHLSHQQLAKIKLSKAPIL